MAHYFSEKQDSVIREHHVEVNLRGYLCKFTTASGMFSIKHLDKGTEVLITNMILREGQEVLDLGCGWGTVGIFAAKMGCTVAMADTNRRALTYTRKNCKANKVQAKVYYSDCYSKVTGEFDAILLNPPQTAGKDVCFRMIEGAQQFLKSGGTLQVVARHNKGGKTLSAKMKEVFGNVVEAGKGSGFRVYIAKNE